MNMIACLKCTAKYHNKFLLKSYKYACANRLASFKPQERLYLALNGQHPFRVRE